MHKHIFTITLLVLFCSGVNATQRPITLTSQLISYVSELAKSNEKTVMLVLTNDTSKSSNLFDWIDDNTIWLTDNSLIMGVNSRFVALTKHLEKINRESTQEYIALSHIEDFDSDDSVDYSFMALTERDISTLGRIFGSACNFPIVVDLDYLDNIIEIYIDTGDMSVSMESYCTRHWPSLLAMLGLHLDLEVQPSGKHTMLIKKHVD